MGKNFTFKLAAMLLISLYLPFNAAYALNAGDCTGYTSTIAPTTNGNTTTITTTHNIDTYNWSKFNIAPNETAFYQFTANGQTAVNYINPGADPSVILGTIRGSSNYVGNVMLFNPNGITIGTGASVCNLNSFFASTNQFNGVAGNNVLFKEPSTTNALNVNGLALNNVNNAHFIAPGVIFNATNVATTNSLSIRAIGGGSYDTVSNTFSDEVAVNNPVLNTDKYIVSIGCSLKANNITVEAKSNYNGDTDILFTGKAEANTIVTDGNSQNGSVYLLAKNESNSDYAYAQVFLNGEINGESASVNVNADRVCLNGNIDASGLNGGTVNINAKTFDQNGNISAKASNGAGGNVDINATSYTAVKNSKIDVTGKTKGGNISVQSNYQILSSGTYDANSSGGNGGNIKISAPLTKLFGVDIDASGYAGGGNIYIGGPGTSGVAINDSYLTILNDSSIINANSTIGKGGNVYLDSKGTTYVFGTVNTKGSGQANSGGYVELSAKEYLGSNYDINVGVGGTIYLDPKNIIIADSQIGTICYNTLLTNGSSITKYTTTTLGLGPQDHFGSSIALYDNLLAVGAENTGKTQHYGAAYLFYFDKGSAYSNLTLFKKLTNNTPINSSQTLTIPGNSYFGSSIALYDNLLAVGAQGTGSSDGTVYLFDFASGTNYNNLHYDNTLLPTSTAYTNFGSGLAIGSYVNSGTTYKMLAVGADGAGNDSGTVLLYRFIPTSIAPYGTIRTDGPTQVLKSATAPTSKNRFGSSVSLSNYSYTSGTTTTNYEVLAVGASGDKPDKGGYIELFDVMNVTSTVAPTFLVKVTDGNTANNSFGSGVAVTQATSGGTNYLLLAGGAEGSDIYASWAGAVYLYHLTGSNFTGSLTVPYSTSDGVITNGSGSDRIYQVPISGGDYFGSSVAFGKTTQNGTTYNLLGIGADQDNTSSQNEGAIYLMTYDLLGSGHWNWRINSSTKIDSTTNTIRMPISTTLSLDPYDYFGSSVALYDNMLAIGAIGDATLSTTNKTGAAYLFGFDSGTKYQNITLYDKLTDGSKIGSTTLDLADGDKFGSAVALGKVTFGTTIYNLLAIGAEGDDGYDSSTSTAIPNSGAAYLIEFSPGGTYSNMSLYSKMAAKGSTGVTYVVDLKANDYFGSSAALSDITYAGDYYGLLASGAKGDDEPTKSTIDSGALYVFDFNPTDGLDLSTKVDATTNLGGNYLSSYDYFGSSAAFYKYTSASTPYNVIAVGAPGDATLSSNNKTGTVYICHFFDSGSTFPDPVFDIKLTNGYEDNAKTKLNLASGDKFGSAVALYNGLIAVGAKGDSTVDSNAGAVYMFDTENTTYAKPNIGIKLADQSSIVRTDGTEYILDLQANGYFGSSAALYDNLLAVGVPGYNSGTKTSCGGVYLFSTIAQEQGKYRFEDYPTATIYLSPSKLESWLESATPTTVILQANNDIIFRSSVAVTGGTGNELSLQAGESITIEKTSQLI